MKEVVTNERPYFHPPGPPIRRSARDVQSERCESPSKARSQTWSSRLRSRTAIRSKGISSSCCYFNPKEVDQRDCFRCLMFTRTNANTGCEVYRPSLAFIKCSAYPMRTSGLIRGVRAHQSAKSASSRSNGAGKNPSTCRPHEDWPSRLTVVRFHPVSSMQYMYSELACHPSSAQFLSSKSDSTEPLDFAGTSRPRSHTRLWMTAATALRSSRDGQLSAANARTTGPPCGTRPTFLKLSTQIN